MARAFAPEEYFCGPVAVTSALCGAPTHRQRSTSCFVIDVPATSAVLSECGVSEDLPSAPHRGSASADLM